MNTSSEHDSPVISFKSHRRTITETDIVNFVNLLGWCALALPSGTTSQDLPFGVTFIAPGGSDAALAQVLGGWQF